MADRYEIRKEDGGWSVVDRFTGLPVTLTEPLANGQDPLVGLYRDEAEHLVDLLNGLDRLRRGVT
jgi:hypothetical protein